MKQKIEWYREVLELEPGSRVFFPLAKLLAADNQAEEAITALRQGLSRHPEFVEARLLLIELLYSEGEQSAAAELVETLAGLLKEYPHFWQAWSEKLAASPSMRDAALSLRFFAAALSGKTVRWADILESGLAHLFGDETGTKEAVALKTKFTAPVDAVEAVDDEPAQALENERSVDTFSDAGASDIPETLAEAELETHIDDVAEAPAEASFDAVSDDSLPDAGERDISNDAGADFTDEADNADDTQDSFADSLTDIDDDLPSLSLDDQLEAETGEEEEEAFSLRTRSMADVLAEQGDYEGALEIYTELADAAPDSERAELETRIAELSQQASMHKEDADRREPQQPQPDKNRVAELLESLALRLEARAQ